MKRLLSLVLLLSILALNGATSAEELSLKMERYEGIEFSCHIEKNLCWYEFSGMRLAQKTLKPHEVKSLQDCLQKENFWTLPAKMGNPRMDSFSKITVGSKGKPYTVFATDSPGEEGPETHARFQRINAALWRVAPIPEQIP